MDERLLKLVDKYFYLLYGYRGSSDRYRCKELNDTYYEILKIYSELPGEYFIKQLKHPDDLQEN